MSDLERTVLDFYRISELNPSVWPEELNAESDGSDEEGGARAREQRAKMNRRKSRYQALERAATHRASGMPGAEKGVQRDEPDPLGTTDSVMMTLKRNGLKNVMDDAKLRNRFLLSSTTFSPGLFLSQFHTNASTEALVAGLDVLSRSIEGKSASLKMLVESNFERFVRAKATIDNVYKEMKYHGVEPAPAPPPRTRTHSRHSSRSGFRGSIGGGITLAPPGAGPANPQTGTGTSPVTDARKRNALVKESEYGVLGIKVPLLEACTKAEDVWGPALGGREREETLRVVASALAAHHECVEASATVAECIKRHDHEGLVEEYHKARRFADEARQTVQALKRKAQGPEARPTDEQMHAVLLAARMWHDVDEQVQAYKRDVWRRLTSMHSAPVALTDTRTDTRTTGTGRDQHMELIGLLLELGVEDNPIWVWLLSRYDHLKSRIQTVCERTKVEIEVLRRRLAGAEKPAAHVVAAHLRSVGRPAMAATTTATTATTTTTTTKTNTLDTYDVIELWDKVHGFLAGLLSAQGILGEVVEFWHTVEGFVAGTTQAALPGGYGGESQKHHRLSAQGALDLQKGAVELVDLIREHVFSFFAGPPPEDVSLLFSPVPPSPRSPRTPRTPRSPGSSGALRDPRFALDPRNPPPPSPRRGEPWEKFAFWPPWSNAVSGVHYLAKMLTLVGSGAAEMARIGTLPGGTADAGEVERLKTLVGAVRERCVAALCAAWNKDAENVKYVEDWHRAADRRDVTKMPAAFAAFEGAILSGMQTILYVSDAVAQPGAGDIVLPPPAKLLQMVRAQYVTTLYKALSGMVENAERPVRRADDWTGDADTDGLPSPPSAVAISSAVMSWLGDGRASAILDSGAFNARDRNVRMLLTLSNLQCLRAEVVPALNTQFENAFSVKLTDETKTIRDVLGQIDSRLFASYTRPSVDSLRQILRAGILDSTDTIPDKPRDVRPYVYEALLLLVLVHSQVSTTAASLTQQVLSHLLEHTSRELLEAFRAQQPPGGAATFGLASLMQATLDVEFVAQTLSQYTTERASELQAQLYQALDARTDDDARARLQSELPEMRSVLKRLREASKNEFACFRKPKRAGASRGTNASGTSTPEPV